MKWSQAVMGAVAATAVCAATLHADEVPGIRGEFLKTLADVQQKVISLAEATPEKKFTWRPSKGVRSISEVYMHIAGANFVLPSFAGVKSPENITPEMEKTVTEKAKVIETMKRSFAHLEQAITNESDTDLDNSVKTFLGDMSVRGVYLTAVNHAHEHLGQSIAYARVNGIVPPWTAADQAAAKKAEMEKKAEAEKK
jgi:uncharacterized damage-inducible protein DinB